MPKGEIRRREGHRATGSFGYVPFASEDRPPCNRSPPVLDPDSDLLSKTRSTFELANLGKRVDALEGLLSKLALGIEAKLDHLRPSYLAPINTLAPEPYDLLLPLQVSVREEQDGFTAFFYDANLGSSGDTAEEAVSNLKEVLVDTFEFLQRESDGALGPELLRQKKVLMRCMRPAG